MTRLRKAEPVRHERSVAFVTRSRRAAEWSGVERGSLVPESMDDWNALRKAAEAP